MKTLLITLGIILLLGCVPTTPNDDDIFKTGEVVKPPYGCTELRKRDGEC